MSSKQEIMNDQRFRRVSKDPRFWEMPEKDRKVKIDKRFRAMFHDKKFKLNYAVDKRGRPITHSTTEDLKRFYDLSDSDSDLSDEESKVLDQKKLKQKKKQAEKEEKSKMLIEEKKKKTKKIDQKDLINKNDLDNSERIQKMKNLCKSQKINSEISPKKDSEEFPQNTKKKRNITDHSTDSLPKEKPRTKDSSTSETVKSPTITCSKAKREKQSGWLGVLILLYYTILLCSFKHVNSNYFCSMMRTDKCFILKYITMKETICMISACFDTRRQAGKLG